MVRDKKKGLLLRTRNRGQNKHTKRDRETRVTEKETDTCKLGSHFSPFLTHSLSLSPLALSRERRRTRRRRTHGHTRADEFSGDKESKATLGLHGLIFDLIEPKREKDALDNEGRLQRGAEGDKQKKGNGLK